MSRLLMASVVLVPVFLIAAIKYGSRVGYETASYRVESEDGPFEIREYDPMVLASTPMAGRGPGEDDSFMRLFRYISGANANEQRIAMTTPVFMVEGHEGGEMSFIAPRELAATGVPPARDARIRVDAMEGGRFAALRFSGRARADDYDRAEQKLLGWVQKQGLETAGQPISAGYDPPFTPSFLRRNEILIRLVG